MADQLDLLGGLQPTLRASAPSSKPRAAVPSPPLEDSQPEESETQEIGIEKVYQSGSSVRMTAFNTSVDNLIEYSGGYTQSTNSRKSQGIEFEGKWLASDTISVDGNYAYVDAVSYTHLTLPTKA